MGPILSDWGQIQSTFPGLPTPVTHSPRWRLALMDVFWWLLGILVLILVVFGVVFALWQYNEG